MTIESGPSGSSSETSKKGGGDALHTMIRCCYLLEAVFLSSFLVATAIPQTGNSSTKYVGIYLSVESWHALTLTNISWDIPVENASLQHFILLSWDKDATEVWRFGENSDLLRADTLGPWAPSTSTPSSSFVPYVSPDEDAESCDRKSAFDPTSTATFYSQEIWSLVTVNLSDSTTWWYTASQDQEAPTETSPTSMSGNASILLSAPGIYYACLVVADSRCRVEECVNVTVLQPPYDFVQIESTNVGALTSVHFNFVTRDTNAGDWGWILGGVDPSFTVEQANELLPSETIEEYEERCWFYFGRAIELGSAFLCSPDPDPTLASLQSTSTVRSYQYGSFRFYMSTAGNMSLWFAKREEFNYAMVESFYTCGITVQALALRTVKTTSDLVVTAVPEQGATCDVNDGIGLRIETDEIRSPDIEDVDARVYFTGRVVSLTSNSTILSIRLPYAGEHVVMVSLTSGAILDTFNVTAIASDPYAPSCLVTLPPPGSLPIGSSIAMSFVARDYYSNTITRSWGDDAFYARVLDNVNSSIAGVSEIRNGSYSIVTGAQNTTGTTFLFVERHGLSIPGSPFEVYLYGPAVCNVISTVEDCGSRLSREVNQMWDVHSPCHGVFDEPTHANMVCGFVPAGSSLGRLMIGCSTSAALYAALYLAWLRRHRETVIVKLSQPFVCQLFLLGCILLNLTSLLYVGVPGDAGCVVRIWLFHIAGTFTSSCLYMKTYRVHLIFNRSRLSRVSITDRQLVIWVLRMVAVDILVLFVWTTLDRPRRAYQSEIIDGIEVLDPYCTGESGFVLFRVILWSWKAWLNVFGVIMAAKTWNCEDGVGESQSICLSVYNTTLLGLGNLAIHLLLADNAVVILGASSLTAVAGTVFTLSVLFGPKVYQLQWHGDLPASSAQRRSSGSGRPSTSSSVDKQRSSSFTNTLTLTASALGLDFSRGKRVQPSEESAREGQACRSLDNDTAKPR